MSEEASNLPAVWEPKKFDGSDLLPMLRPPEADQDEVVGRDNVSSGDLILPSLKLLQPMTPGVADGSIEGARPGLVMHSSTQTLFKPPLRVLMIHHSKSNALLPDPKNPRHNGLERCISRDAVRGDRYGDCETCGKCTKWDDEKRLKPLGSQSHNFVVITELGPAIMRFARSSFRAGKEFVSAWYMANKNLWAHPVVVRVKTVQDKNPDGSPRTYFVWEPMWQSSEQVPAHVRAMARATYDQVQAAFEAGRLSGDDEGTSGDEV